MGARRNPGDSRPVVPLHEHAVDLSTEVLGSRLEAWRRGPGPELGRCAERWAPVRRPKSGDPGDRGRSAA